MSSSSKPQDVQHVADGIAALAARTALVVVHGGGKEIDAALATAGIPKQQVDGLRVTDARTLDVVVAVLAGAINTRLVAAVRKAGGKPVGLTGADASVVTVRRATPIASVAGPKVDLAVRTTRQQRRTQSTTDLLGAAMCRSSPASCNPHGHLLNVNADSWHRTGGFNSRRRLIIAGGTAGVLAPPVRRNRALSARGRPLIRRAPPQGNGPKLEACAGPS